MKPIKTIRQKSEQLLGQLPYAGYRTENTQEAKVANPLLVPTSTKLMNKRKFQAGFRRSPLITSKKDR
jgi:hypothetical protein